MADNNKLTDEQIQEFEDLIEQANANTGWPVYSADIIPSIAYQAYGINDVWFWDNEGLYYNFEAGEDVEPSTIEVKAYVPETSESEESGEEGGEGNDTTEPTGDDTTEPTGDDTTEPTDGEGGESEGEGEGEETEEETYENYEYNKYGKVKFGKTVQVTITPSAQLKEQYPYAVVKINGKEHDLAYLDNPIILPMDRDYRISINWLWNRKVEVFRIICHR